MKRLINLHVWNNSQVIPKKTNLKRREGGLTKKDLMDILEMQKGEIDCLI